MAIKVSIHIPLTSSFLSNINLEFEAIASEFTKPTIEDFLDNTIGFDYTQSPFYSVFSMLGRIMQLEEEQYGDQLSSRQFQLSKYFTGDLISALLRKVPSDPRL